MSWRCNEEECKETSRWSPSVVRRLHLHSSFSLVPAAGRWASLLHHHGVLLHHNLEIPTFTNCGLKVLKSQATSESFFLYLGTCCNNSKNNLLHFQCWRCHTWNQNLNLMTLLSLCFMIKCKYIWLYFRF